MAPSDDWVDFIRPKAIIVGTGPTPLFPGELLVPAYWILVQVRTMGANTYIRVGDNVSQEASFAGIGDYQLFEVSGKKFNAALLNAISDAGSGVLEVSGMGPAGSLANLGGL